jgi:plasmid maintenance system antidote protein VapI
LPKVLFEYCFKESDSYSISEASRRFGMSPGSLRKILTGNDVSENMLFRLQKYFEQYDEFENMSVEEVDQKLFQQWRLTDQIMVQEAISSVSISLAALLKVVLASNQLGTENSPINTLQKAQLIAMLEAMLASLKAPAIQMNETKGLISWIKKIAKRGAEKGIEKGVSDGMRDFIENGEKLVSELATQPGISDLDKLT